MHPSTYHPQPIDTSSICLPPELNELSELMARNVHDEWARQRISQGWTYGPQRDDQRKQHPDLVSYDDLPETERDYDRTTATATLRLILRLGYRIVK